MSSDIVPYEFYPVNPSPLVVLEERWYPPEAFDLVKDEEMRASLKKYFPEGVTVKIVGGVVVEIWPEEDPRVMVVS